MFFVGLKRLRRFRIVMVQLPLYIFLTLSLHFTLPTKVRALDVVDSLKEKVSNLKEESDKDFSQEQEEFERMRAELLAAEQQIIQNELPKSLGTVSADYKFKESAAQKTDSPNARLSDKTQINSEFDDDFADTVELLDQSNPTGTITSIDTAIAEELKILKNKYAAVTTKLTAKETELSAKEKEIAKLKANLNKTSDEALNSRIATLQKELQAVKNKLLVSEAEVERLSVLAGSGSKNARLPAAPQNRAVYSTANRGKQQPTGAAAQQQIQDLTVVTVLADKAYLRTGPGKDNSPLMEVKKGTRLAVEDRQGNWYRITTPTGTRAWISHEVIGFVPSTTPTAPSNTFLKQQIPSDRSNNNNDAQRTDAQSEDKAFELISKRPR